MSDSEKPKSWRERRQSIKHKWVVPFVYVEWRCEQLSILLDQWAFLDILGHAGRISIIIAVIFYFAESEGRQKAKHYQAWQVINLAQGKTGSGGRIDALQDLNRDNASLAGVDISYANLRGINLKRANLREANLSNVHLYEANLSMTHLFRANMSKAFLYEVNLSGADIYEANLAEAQLWLTDLAVANIGGADLTNIIGWQQIKSIRNANIYGVKNPPDGFVEWAKEQGAVSIENREEWEKFRREKIQEQKKEKQ